MENPKMDFKMAALYQAPSAAEAELQEFAIRLFLRWTISKSLNLSENGAVKFDQ